MAERNEQVLDTVRKELNKNPGRGSKELYEVAIGVEPSIAENTLQQFHARYVLPIKREHAAAKDGSKGKKEADAKAPAPAVEAKPARSRARKQKPMRAQADEPATGDTRGRRDADRDRVRSLFLQFARDFANAESRGEIVEVLSSVDRYVDQIVSEG
jgi:hypothetical protein